MESEKVKEIKKALEFQKDGLYFLQNNCVEVVYCKDILTYINELESENERIKNIELLHYLEEATSNKLVCETFNDKLKAEYWRGQADTLKKILNLNITNRES